MSAGRPLVLACSPRAGGNTDRAAAIMARAAATGLHGEPELLHLRDFDVRPCLGCGACARHPEGCCARAAEDEAEALFARLLAAPWAAVAAPIYFYHLPAQFKAWIDRSQRFHSLVERGDPAMAALPERAAHVCLVAGRPRGEKLFAGSLLTLGLFFRTFHMTVTGSLGLRGLDGPGDLEADARAGQEVEALGRAMGGKRAGG